MVLHYRETDPVSGRWTGNTSGVPLSSFQGDENVYTLDAAIAAVSALVTPSRYVISITQSTAGNDITFIMSDSTTIGPFPIPTVTLNPRGAWLANISYSVNDLFYINGTVYIVIFPDPGQSSFDAGANDGLGHNYFAVFVPNPGNALPTGGATGQVLQKSSSTDFATTWGDKLPSGGTAFEVLLKQSSANQDADWATPNAVHVSFSPSTASGLTSTNVADALEEIEASLAGISLVASAVTYTPSGSLTSTNVQDAIDELETVVGGGGNAFGGFSTSPTGNISTTETAMGLGGGLSAFAATPVGSGIFMVWIAGVVVNSSGAGDGVTIRGRHGNGTAPSNGDTSSLGTQFSTPQHFVASTTAGQQGFVVMGKITGLTVGVTEWFDLSIVAVTAGGATVKDVQFVAIEV